MSPARPPACRRSPASRSARRSRSTGDEAHHAVAVRRLGSESSVVLTDGRGRTAVGAVTATGKRGRRSGGVGRRLAAAEPVVTVVQAIPKGDRGELAVEMLTEIGVAPIVPWAAARSSPPGRASALAHAAPRQELLAIPGVPRRWPIHGPGPPLSTAGPPHRPRTGFVKNQRFRCGHTKRHSSRFEMHWRMMICLDAESESQVGAWRGVREDERDPGRWIRKG